MIHRQLGLLGTVLVLAIGCARLQEAHYEPRGPEVRLSLLALGDWGRRPHEGQTPAKQLRVAEALAAEDRAAPADAVLFVGDNFYPHGLEASEVEFRLRANLVGPYCHFVALSARGAATLGDACLEPQVRRHPLPLFAVLGNHDHTSTESIALERDRVDDYVSNWRLVGLPVETLELPQGVSLVFYDSTALRRSANASSLPLLTRALAQSRGPWRVLVAHHPLAGRPLDRGIESALADAGVRPQLLLAGHIHDLRAAVSQPPLPAFQLVSGGGGGAESNRDTLAGEVFQLASTGFARVDLVGGGASAHLRLRLFEVSSGGGVARVVAAWKLGLDGSALPETLETARE
jgi:calcineurin-like phosphoesterase family protein